MVTGVDNFKFLKIELPESWFLSQCGVKWGKHEHELVGGELWASD